LMLCEFSKISKQRSTPDLEQTYAESWKHRNIEAIS
jgi:hypothetical protein